MEIVIGAAVGLLWGALIAWLNSRITAKAIARGTTNAVMTGNLTRTAVDIAALTVVFLLRKVLPFSFEATIVSTAVALGILTVLFAFRMAKAVDGKSAGDAAGVESGEKPACAEAGSGAEEKEAP